MAIGAAIVAVIVAAIVWNHAHDRREQIKRHLKNAQRALRTRNFVRAAAEANAVLALAPKTADALLVAGQAAAAQKHDSEALEYLRSVPVDDTAVSVEAQFSLGELALRIGRASEAEIALRNVLQHQPDHHGANYLLAFLLGAECRAWESLPYVETLVRQQRCDVPQLLLCGMVDEFFIDQKEFRALCRSAAADDPLPRLVEARLAIIRNDRREARRVLEEILARRPDSMEAQANWGRLLVEDQDPEFLNWNAKLPPAADTFPEIWTSRGRWLLRAADPRGAVRCFWEALRLNPNHRVANLQMAQALESLSMYAAAQTFAARAGRLGQLAVPLKLVDQQRDPDLMRRIVGLLDALGRPWESAAWCRIARRYDAQATWPTERLDQLALELRPDIPFTLVQANPTHNFDIAHFPRPQFATGSQKGPSMAHDGNSDAIAVRLASDAAVEIRFNDDAPTAGIDFTYFNSAEAPDNMLYMHQFPGGAVLAIDFDQDGRPDLYCGQGCPFPASEPQTKYLDQLYRNVDGARFENVTRQSGLVEDAFTQGGAVGDFDSDGFPDVFVCNIGRNRLWRNNGDGTWADATNAAGFDADTGWSTSAVMADLNDDGLPDVYFARYAQGDDVFTRICESEGHQRQCSPATFRAAQDELLLNLGDGRFEKVSRSAGTRMPVAGHGLGVVAADFRGTGRLDLFVANDTDPNFLFDNQTAPGGTLRFVERGAAAGVAFDTDGRALASMGVAAGDIDNDGRIDLFVTNFFDEPNSLYRQVSPGLFADNTRAAGLHDPGFHMLGFGTQFLDADLDGWQDIVVTNGHVYDQPWKGVPLEMPPQFFRNVGGRRFEEVPARQLGPFFEARHVGRALTRLDWNGDGRGDAAIGHLNEPVALLTNRTATTAATFVIELRGVSSSRDAIGATVRVKAADRHWTQQLTAGDGYLASNERKLIFAVGAAQQIDEVEIHWPAGDRQVFSDLATGSTYVCVEGRACVPLP
jgi:tetratricopeptide (TPR) repeat protein